MFKNFFLSISLFFCLNIQAATININLSLVHKKPIDKTLVLKNEHHERVDILPGEERVIELKNDMEVIISAKYYDVEINERIFEIKAEIYSIEDLLRSKLNSFKLLTRENEKARSYCTS